MTDELKTLDEIGISLYYKKKLKAEAVKRFKASRERCKGLSLENPQRFIELGRRMEIEEFNNLSLEDLK